MKITRNQLRLFTINGKNLISQTNKSKLSYAIEKVLKQTKKLDEEYSELVEDTRVKFASVDEKGYLLVDDRGGYKITPEKQIEFRKAIKALGEESILIEPFYVTEYDEKLISFDLKEIFLNIVIQDEVTAEPQQA